jgi:hypothetical protein
MSRPTVKYLGLLALTFILVYWKTLLTDQFTLIVGTEGVNMSYAWFHFWVESIWKGHLPLWDPYTFAGGPFAALMLPSAFYPLHLLFTLVPMNQDGLVSPRLFHGYLALTHLLCAYFTFALLRELDRSRFASYVGACAFALGGLLVRMIWPPYIESCIWLPAVFLFLLRALRALNADRRERALIQAIFAGLCLGLSILTGGMSFFFMQVIFAVTALAYYGVVSPRIQSPRIQNQRVWIGGILAVALAVAGGLAAVQLLPANEYGHESVRFIDGGIIPAAEKIPYERLVPGMWPQSIVSAFFPSAYDGKIGGEETFSFYVGVFPVLLAIIAVWKCRENLWVKFLAGLIVVVFAYSLGEFSPLHGVLYAVVPFLWLTRAANRFFYLISFALAILAAFGLDALLDPANLAAMWTPAKRIVKWVAICAAAALVLPGLFMQLNLGIWNAFSLLLILGSCAWFVRLAGAPASTGLRAMLALFILFDLSAFNWVEINRAALGKDDMLKQLVTLRGAAGFIKARPGPHRVRVSVEPQPNIGDAYGIEGIWGGGATILAGYSQLGFRDDLLNVRYSIKPVTAPDPGPIYKDAQWKVYENPNAYPRAWVVHQAVVAPSHEAAFQQLDRPGIDLRRVAVLEKPLPRLFGPDIDADETVHFHWYEPEKMAMEVKAGTAGLVVLSEMYYPGWVATVNGKAAPIYRVDGALRGVFVSGGTSRIELVYAPASFRIGALVSLLTLAFVIGGWIYLRKRDRQ